MSLAIDLNWNFFEFPSSNKLLHERFLMHFITFSKFKLLYFSISEPGISKSLFSSFSSVLKGLSKSTEKGSYRKLD